MAKKSMKIKQARPQKYATRQYNRCKICGRPHAYIRKFGICRVCFRELAHKGEIPGVVEQILGHGKLKVRCNDKNIRLCRIPGKMKKRIWIREGDVVLVKPWDFQSNEKADVIWRYTRTEANYLERRGFLKI